MPEIIKTEIISQYHNNPLARPFEIDKTRKLVTRKYYWKTLCQNLNSYIKGYDVYLALKAVRHKPYGDLQLLPIPTYQWKDLSIDFVTGLPISTDWKNDGYDSILVIVDWLIKMVHYELIKVIIDVAGLKEVILDVVVRHYGLPDLIVTNRGLLFTLNFWPLLCYFLRIK